MKKPVEPIFQHLKTLVDIAEFLESSARQLRLLLYGRPQGARYRTFTIAKRRGGQRTISSPANDLKSLQRRLARQLQMRVPVRSAAHGFIPQRSIVTNAERHISHRTVLNIDLKDFFPSINFGRVRGLFMAQPCSACAEVATVLAQICCHDNALPQGAPTSPVVSNMVCHRLDVQLQRLAHQNNCSYTRYADDLTFSRRKGPFPAALAEESEGNIVLGEELRSLIEANGFQIHPEKVHLFRNTHRQIVTGLTVNRRVNVPRSFVRDVRAIICDWRRRGLDAAEKRHHEQHYRRTGKRGDFPPLSRILEGKLSYLKMVSGVADPVRRNLQRQLVVVWPEYHTVMERENRELKQRDFFVSHASEDKDDFVRPLVNAMIRAGISVWYDEYEMTIGSDLVKAINEGLERSEYGIVVLSPSFFSAKKTWPDREVGALTALEDADKRPRILPIWHNVDRAEVAHRNPLLARLFAWKSSEHSPDALATKFRDFLKDKRATRG